MPNSKKGYLLEKDTIAIQRDLTELDLFAKKFLDTLKRHTDYLVVSGFVSICTGRTRGTEDIDILIPAMGEKKFNALFKELEKNNFWCYQGDDPGKVYEYMENLNSIRFAKTNEIFPNIELVPFNQTKKAKFFEFSHPQKIKIRDFEFKIPPLEFEILYKEIILRGKKDIEDAKHLRIFFSEIVSEKKFKEYGPIIRDEIK
ncbi:MAG: hypothetical protein AABX32_01025 [Nanoarchaeota archaeon]|mgnify:FL=1